MRNEGHKGYFITLEGGDGSGKSTLLHQLVDFFKERGFDVLVTREPGGTALGEAIRALLLERNPSMPIGDLSELLLFLAARAEHIQEKILPALDQGTIVLCDRFNDSTIAYQGGARGLGIAFVQKLCHLVCGDLVPDVTLFLDVSPEIGLQRVLKANQSKSQAEAFDRIEAQDLSFHHKIREIFHSLVKLEPQRIHLLDANQSQEAVWKKACALLAAKLDVDRSKMDA